MWMGTDSASSSGHCEAPREEIDESPLILSGGDVRIPAVLGVFHDPDSFGLVRGVIKLADQGSRNLLIPAAG